MYLGVVNTGYAGSFFTPTILTQLGWTHVKAQVMSIPIYIVAAVLCLIVAIATDKLQHRFAFIILGCTVASVGYIILLNQGQVSTAVRYFAVYMITAGGYIAQPVAIVWLNNNMGGHYKRGIAAAVQIGFGNCGGLIASNVFITKEAPTYPVGFGVSLALLWVCGLSACVFLLLLWRENRNRARGRRDYRLRYPEALRDNLGDDHPSFVYTY